MHNHMRHYLCWQCVLDFRRTKLSHCFRRLAIGVICQILVLQKGWNRTKTEKHKRQMTHPLWNQCHSSRYGYHWVEWLIWQPWITKWKINSADGFGTILRIWSIPTMLNHRWHDKALIFQNTDLTDSILINTICKSSDEKVFHFLFL